MVFFYYPTRDYNPLPASMADYGPWQSRIAREGGLIGPACWVVQTCLQLQSRGFGCRLTQDPPSAGIVIAHFDDIPQTLSQRGAAYWVCALADRQNAHPFANYYVLQNPYQRLRTRQPSSHVLHWKQPGLIPRAAARQGLFTHLRFFGEHVSLAPEFTQPDFIGWCEREGFDFQVVPREHWHNYSDCDAVIGVRGLHAGWVHDKPATKLVNAWVAGAPAILGRESAFRALGAPGETYLEAASMADVRGHLIALRNDRQLLQSIVNSGFARAGCASDDSITQMWVDAIDRQIKPRAARWHRYGVLRLWHRASARLLQGLAWRYRLISTEFVEPPLNTRAAS